MKRIFNLMMAAALVAGLSGCGSDEISYAPDNYVIPAGTTTLAFTAISTARLDSAIGGIDMAVVLPAGMSVVTESGSNRITATAVQPGAALPGTSLAFGRYSSAPVRKARLTMGTVSTTYRSGEFLRLTCTVDQGTSISVADLRTLNNPVELIKAAGGDTSNSYDLTGKVRLRLELLH